LYTVGVDKLVVKSIAVTDWWLYTPEALAFRQATGSSIAVFWSVLAPGTGQAPIMAVRWRLVVRRRVRGDQVLACVRRRTLTVDLIHTQEDQLVQNWVVRIGSSEWAVVRDEPLALGVTDWACPTRPVHFTVGDLVRLVRVCDRDVEGAALGLRKLPAWHREPTDLEACAVTPPPRPATSWSLSGVTLDEMREASAVARYRAVHVPRLSFAGGVSN
jgi:hypothetical protein